MRCTAFGLCFEPGGHKTGFYRKLRIDSMILKWLGHSCFLLTSDSGMRVLMDPCAPKTGYTIAPVEVDAVTASHDHYDHNYFEAALGDPIRITEPGMHEVHGVHIMGIPTWHDKEHGAKRGRNIMFLVEMDGIRLLHAGDLGHLPDEAAIAAAGRVDVLLAPIGGVFTIDGEEAKKLAEMLHPKVFVPMHYKTEQLSFELGGLKPFLDSIKGGAIHRMRQSEATLTPESLGSGRVLVLECAKPGAAA
ncbi:MAG: MBL fold metallo-hydrolase [Clostridia bacterium]|nr:MAG: MBL fold metallo-hydrolase [Clostridia bacterium]